MLKLISPLLLIPMTVALQLVLLAGLLLLKQGEPISPLLSLSLVLEALAIIVIVTKIVVWTRRADSLMIGDKQTASATMDDDPPLGVGACLTATVPVKAKVAFVSWAYNVGTGAACSSRLVRKANAGDVVGACNELPKWNRAGGRVVRGLTNRREAERQLCLEGVAEGA